MFIQGNKLGLLMFVICGLVAIGGGFLLKLPDVVTMIGVGSALTLMDIIVRFRARALSDRWLLSKEIGGYLYFIPAWIGGIVVIAINIISRLQPA